MAVYDHPRSARLPIVQYIISLIVCFDIVDRKETTAPRKLCITTPARMRLCVGIFRPSRASAITNHNVTTPVKKATSGNVQIPISAYCKPKKIRKAAPTEAPEETPNVNGSASGLRSTPWNPAPAIASEAPTSIPSSTRGKRTFQIICSAALLQSGVIQSPTHGIL